MCIFICRSCLAEFIDTVGLKPSLTSSMSYFDIFLAPLAHESHNNPTLQSKPPQEEADASA